MSAKKFQVNGEIKDHEVRVVDEIGSQLGLMTAADAIKLAESRGFDLVKIAPLAVPPVCKVVDYGKFKFEQTKKEKEAKKNQKITEVKEIRLSLNIDEHDFNTKVKNATKFLKLGNKVKVSVRFKGRELVRPTAGSSLLDRFKQNCEEFGFTDKPNKMDGRNLTALLNPKTLSQIKK